jgi:HK97 family phage prohead protease
MKEKYTRLAPAADVTVESSTRLVKYLISDESVGRDRFIVKNSAWQLENFARNPVLLFGHDDTQPPIGRWFNVHVADGALRGTAEYATTDFAETVYQLVKGGFLRAVSTSWLPIEYQRGDGEDVDAVFTKVDLLEISQVPVPALPSALASARACGIDTRPLQRWAERALDTPHFRAVSRSELRAIERAARGRAAATYIGALDAGRASRVARARALVRAGNDRQLYERYEGMRSAGFTIEQAATALLIPSGELRRIIARVLEAST